jgi:hypothetical protein
MSTMSLLPWKSTALHLIGQLHVLGVDVELPLPLAQHSRQHGAGVYAHPHVHGGVGRLLNIPGEWDIG